MQYYDISISRETRICSMQTTGGSFSTLQTTLVQERTSKNEGVSFNPISSSIYLSSRREDLDVYKSSDLPGDPSLVLLTTRIASYGTAERGQIQINTRRGGRHRKPEPQTFPRPMALKLASVATCTISRWSGNIVRILISNARAIVSAW